MPKPDKQEKLPEICTEGEATADAIYNAVGRALTKWEGIQEHLNLIFFMLVLAALGFGTLLAALIVAQRDFRYVLAFGVQLWMFATPAIYLPPQTFGSLAQTWLPFNPAYGLILNFRQAVLGGPFDWYALGISSAVSVLLLVVGAAYFRRVERSFADII